MSGYDAWMEKFNEAASPAEWAEILRRLNESEGHKVADAWLNEPGAAGLLAERCAVWFPGEQCRTCSECDRGDHHWMADVGGFGMAIEDPSHPAAMCGLDMWDLCKHCDGVFRPVPDEENEWID